ncbi:MAG: glycerophosphodiester phosphodiesterase [Promethearchaeota archaeon]
MKENEALVNGEFIINSHRGAFKSGLLENSIPAFIAAINEGANVIECDIRKTRDNGIVLIHNRTIDHMACQAIEIPDPAEFGGEEPTGLVSKHTTAYLKALKFNDGAGILTLQEFIEFLVDNKVGAQIELKETGYEPDIIKVLRRVEIDHESLRGPVVFTSFNPFAILRLKKLLWKTELPKYDYFANKKGVCLGLQAISLGAFYGKWMLRKCRKNRIWGFMTHYRHLPVFRIPYAHENGVKFCPRVPDDESLVLSYIEGNVDGFETDNVQFIKKCIAKAGYEFKG